MKTNVFFPGKILSERKILLPLIYFGQNLDPKKAFRVAKKSSI